MPANAAYEALLAGTHVARYKVSPLFGALTYTATVSATPTFPAKAIAITSGVGTIANVKAGQRVMIRNAGGSFKGVTHVRFYGTISTSSIPIRETSSGSIDIASGDILTIYSLPLLVDKLVESDSAFNPDGLPIGDVNQFPLPLVSSGGWYVNTLPASGTLGVPMHGGGSTTVDIASTGVVTHAWSCASGTFNNATAANPIFTVTAAGEYILTHAVTDVTNSKVATQIVPVRVHDAADPPMECILNSVDGDAKGGGIRSASFQLFGNVSLEALPDGTPVILWADDERIGGDVQSFGHKNSGRSNILMVGYLRRDEWTLDDEGVEGVTFEVISPIALLAEIVGYSKVMENNATPDVWSEIKDLSVSRAITQILQHYTNALQLFDLIFVGFVDADYPTFFLQRSTPYDQVVELADGLLSRLICDRAGGFEIQRRLECTPLDERNTPVTTITLTKSVVQDWSMSRDHRLPLDTLKTNGFIKGLADNTAVFAKFPASPGTGTLLQTITRLILQDADERLEVTALLGAWENHVFFDADGVQRYAPELTLELAGSYGRLFQFYREWVKFTGVTTLRNIDLSTFRWLVMAVSESFEDGTASTTLTLRAETNAPARTAVDDTPLVEVLPPTEPPVYYPPVGDPDPPTDGNGLGDFAGTLAVFDGTNSKVHITTNFDRLRSAGTPTWTGNLISLTGTLSAFAYKAGTSVSGYLATTSQVRTIADIFGARTLGTAQAYTATTASQVQLQTERGDPENCIVILYYDTGGAAAYKTSNGGTAWAAGTGLTANYDTNYINNTPNWIGGLYLDPDGSGYAISSSHTATGNPPGSAFYESSNGGATWALVVRSGWTIDNYNARCIVRPLGRPDDVLFFGNTAIVVFPVCRLFRVIGTTRTDISPVVGGKTYGVTFSGAQRAISVADDDPNAVVLVGNDNTGVSGEFGVFQTFNGLATAPTWTTIVTPTTTVKYRGAYYVNRNTIYLFGNSGAIAICKYNGIVWTVYAMTISGCGTIVGLCGG